MFPLRCVRKRKPTTKSYMSGPLTKNFILTVEADRWVGITEQGGDNVGQIVEMFQKQIGHAVGEPWCMSFVQYCCYWVDRFLGMEDRHVLYPSEHVLTVWRKTPSVARLKEPMMGSVVLWNYAGTEQGHAGIVTDRRGDTLDTVEGNTSEAERRVIREGDGVFNKKRSIHGGERFRILGYLNPWPPGR